MFAVRPRTDLSRGNGRPLRARLLQALEFDNIRLTDSIFENKQPGGTIGRG